MPLLTYQITAVYNLPSEGLSESQFAVQSAAHDALAAIGVAVSATDVSIDVGDPELQEEAAGPQLA